VRKILVITNNLNQGSFRFRILPLVERLRPRGFELQIEVRPKAVLARRALMRRAGEFDGVILQRKLLDAWDAKRLRRHARRIVYDIDDAVMLPQTQEPFWVHWRLHWRFVATARVVDHVAAGNEYLAEMFRARGCAVTIVPTVVDPAPYRPKTHGETDRPTLVWSGSRSTAPYVRTIYPALAEARRRVPGLRLLIVNDDPMPDAPLPCEFVQWKPGIEPEALVQGDIGIAPTPDDPWTRGKCGFKIVQYMAAGLPAIASPVGANAGLVRAGETGFLPTSEAEWVDAIVRLAGDAALRSRMGAAGRARVDAELNLDHVADLWAKLLS
jgi:glycosyltransferase involved in cell wall biosynthesis